MEQEHDIENEAETAGTILSDIVEHAREFMLSTPTAIPLGTSPHVLVELLPRRQARALLAKRELVSEVRRESGAAAEPLIKRVEDFFVGGMKRENKLEQERVERRVTVDGDRLAVMIDMSELGVCCYLVNNGKMELLFGLGERPDNGIAPMMLN